MAADDGEFELVVIPTARLTQLIVIMIATQVQISLLLLLLLWLSGKETWATAMKKKATMSGTRVL